MSPRNRWQVLAPRSRSVTASGLPPTLFLELTFLSTTHLCQTQPGCLQVLGKLPEPFTISLKREEKQPGVPPCQRSRCWVGRRCCVLFAAISVLRGGSRAHMLACRFALLSCMSPPWRAAIEPVFSSFCMPLFHSVEPQNVTMLSW